MPLPQPQVIDVDMGLGLDTFTDPKRVMPGKFTTLENVRFQRGKRLEMRRGNVAYGGTYKIGNTGSATNSFGVFSNELSIRRTQNIGTRPVFYSEYNRSDNATNRSAQKDLAEFRDLNDVGSQYRRVMNSSPPNVLPNNVTKVKPYFQPAVDTAVVDCCRAGDFIVSIWSEVTTAASVSASYYYDVRRLDGSVHRPRTSLFSSSAGAGWCMAVATATNEVWFFTANNATTSVLVTLLEVSSGVFSSFGGFSVASLSLDAVVLGSSIYVAGHNFDGGVGVVIKSATIGSFTGTFTAKNAFALGGATLRSLAFAAPLSTATKLRVLWADTTNGIRGGSITASSGALVTGPTTMIALPASGSYGYQMSACELSDDVLWGAVSILAATYRIEDTTLAFSALENGTFNTYTTSTAIGLLAARVVRRTDIDSVSFWTRYYNAALTTSGMLQYQSNFTGSCVCGRQMSGRGVPRSTTIPGVASTVAISSDEDVTHITDSFRVLVGTTTTREAVRGLARIETTYDMRAAMSAAETNGVLVLGAGVLSQWDGVLANVVGHLIRPDVVSSTTSAVGGSLSNGTYSCVAVAEWTDGAGNRQQSAPSDPFSVVLSGGTATQQFTAVMAANISDPARVSFVVYSTTNGGTLYYRASETGAADPLVRTVSDTNLIARSLLYTTGGVLPNAMPDGAPVVGKFNDRIILSDPIDEGSLFVQKTPVQGAGPEFSDELTLPISAAGGAVTAIVENVDKCCVFKENSIQVFTGEGYTTSGSGGGYSPAETIHDTLGCPGPWAAVSTKLGVMFDSGGQGIWLLGRDLQITWIGEAVDSFKDIQVQRALATPDQDEVRFLLTNDTTLVYTLSTGTWAVFTDTPCHDIGLAGAEPIWLRKSASNLGGVYVESDTVFNDFMNGVINVSAANMTMTAVTGWLNLAGLQGYMRIWRVLFTGDYGDTHTLLIDAGYDYDESTYPDDFELTSANIGLPYDGQVWLRRGYSKSVRLKIRASSSAGDTVGPMSLTGLSLEVGILPRGARMKASKGA